MKKLLLIIATLMLTTACSIEKIDPKEPNSDEVTKNYEVTKNHNFYDLNEEEVITFLTEGTGVIIFAYPESPYSEVALPVLGDITDEYLIEKVYYFNPKEIREENNEDYQEIINILEEFLNEDEEENKILTVPNVTVVKEGKIVGSHISTIENDGEFLTHLTETQEEELKKIYSSKINKLFMCEGTCD